MRPCAHNPNIPIFKTHYLLVIFRNNFKKVDLGYWSLKFAEVFFSSLMLYQKKDFQPPESAGKRVQEGFSPDTSESWRNCPQCRKVLEKLEHRLINRTISIRRRNLQSLESNILGNLSRGSLVLSCSPSFSEFSSAIFNTQDMWKKCRNICEAPDCPIGSGLIKRPPKQLCCSIHKMYKLKNFGIQISIFFNWKNGHFVGTINLQPIFLFLLLNKVRPIRFYCAGNYCPARREKSEKCWKYFEAPTELISGIILQSRKQAWGKNVKQFQGTLKVLKSFKNIESIKSLDRVSNSYNLVWINLKSSEESRQVLPNFRKTLESLNRVCRSSSNKYGSIFKSLDLSLKSQRVLNQNLTDQS